MKLFFHIMTLMSEARNTIYVETPAVTKHRQRTF